MNSDFDDIFDFMARDPFPWQVEQAEAFQKKILDGNGSGNFTLVAAPNSGKTDAAAMNMLIARSKFGVRQFFFLSPTSVIKDQVIEDFSHVGLFFSSGYNNRKLIRSRLDPVLDGISCSYQQIARFPELYRKLTSDTPTFVCGDEIHHLAKDKSWGDAFKYAFEHAQIRMFMSGTPFRCDGAEIPFVTYKEE